MLVQLKIKDRLAILQMLPQQGSLEEMVDIMEIIKKIRLEQEEKDKVNYKELGQTISWDITKDVGKEVDFKFEEVQILKNAVKLLDDNKKVNISNFDICLKINQL